MSRDLLTPVTGIPKLDHELNEKTPVKTLNSRHFFCVLFTTPVHLLNYLHGQVELCLQVDLGHLTTVPVHIYRHGRGKSILLTEVRPVP